MNCTSRTALSLAVAGILSTVGLVHAEDAPTTAPARTAQEVMQSVRSTQMQIGKAIGGPTAFSDPKQRATVAPAALPLLKQLDANFHELATVQPKFAAQLDDIDMEILENRAALDDASAGADLDRMAKSPDSGESVRGQVAQLGVQWMQAGTDATAQQKVVDAADPLAHAHTDNATLTIAMAQWSQTATPELSDRLLQLATEVMKNPAVARATQAKEEVAAARQLKAMENHPLTVAGTTVDGKAFTTADWKGKVILVDFWATWCGPCVAGLPEVKATYQKYHDKGLEIIGVSNDYSPEKLSAFIAKDEMPWPQLYDAAAGSAHSWSSITLGYGIHAIPHMFVIDREGNLLSSDARATFPKLIENAIGEVK